MNWSVELEDGTIMHNTGQTGWRKVLNTKKKIKKFMLNGKEIDSYCNRYMVFNQVHVSNIQRSQETTVNFTVFCGATPEGEMILRAFDEHGNQKAFHRGNISHEIRLQMDEIGIDAV